MIRILGPRKKLLVIPSRKVLLHAFIGLDISAKEFEALMLCDESPVLPAQYAKIQKKLRRRALIQRSRSGYWFLTTAGETVVDIAKDRIKAAIHCIPQFKFVPIQDTAIDIVPKKRIRITIRHESGPRRKESP